MLPYEKENSLEDETIDITIDVDVDELWTRTVASKPTINPAKGFERTAPSVNIWPVTLPNKINILFRNFNEQNC